MTIFAP